MTKNKLAIIGGSGLYDVEEFKERQFLKINTPWGKPSDEVLKIKYKGKEVCFLPRHGKGHFISPTNINFRANIWAFKELGVKRIIAPSAVGSLKEEFEPGNLALPSQFIDFTKSRKGTFSEDGKVIHISVADPFCPELQKVILNVTKTHGIKIHQDCTYVCIEGPRFSTKAESRFFRTTGADIIGMTLVPECQLAREAQICYVSLSTVTDYDVWAEKPVTAKEVMETLAKNVEMTKKLLTFVIDQIPEVKSCSCEKALEEAEF